MSTKTSKAREFLKSGTGRGLIGIFGWWVALGVSFMLEDHFLMGGLVVLTGMMWAVVWFWPEIRRLRVIDDPNEAARLVMPVWLYIFAFAAVGAVGVWGASIYYSMKDRPTVLTADEFSQQFISGKRFRLTDFTAYSGNNVIENRVFEDCVIYGPAVISLHGGYFQEIELAVDALDYALLEAPVGKLIFGVIELKNCVFRRCRFSNVAFLGTPKLLEVFKAAAQKEIPQGKEEIGK